MGIGDGVVGWGEMLSDERESPLVGRQREGWKGKKIPKDQEGCVVGVP